MAEPQITVFVNEKPKEIPADWTVSRLLEFLQVEHPAIAVEINEEIQTKAEFDSRRLKDQDRIEIVSLVGGG